MEEKTIDIKGTFEQFIKTDEPELEQEEAIKKYGENPKKRKYESDDPEDMTEEAEHLKRIKEELLAALDRIKKLEQKMYGREETSKEDIKQSLKTAGGSQGKGSQQVEKIAEESEKQQKERE